MGYLQLVFLPANSLRNIQKWGGCTMNQKEKSKQEEIKIGWLHVRYK